MGRWFLWLFALLTLAGTAIAQSKPPVVLAAASLQESMNAAADAWVKRGHARPTLSFAASSALARQVAAGAPADLFVSADQAWMDYAKKSGSLKPGSRVDLLRNALVLIASGPKTPGSDPQIALAPDLGTTLSRILGGGKLAMATIDAVPAGKYGKAALEKLGAWDSVKGQVAQAENVRAALLLVARGEAPLGIVYATDAAADPSVHVIATFPSDSHPPIVYPAALLKDSANPDAAALLTYLRGPAARGYFEHQGFTVVEKPGVSQ